MKKKLYIVEKVLWATSISDALKREKTIAPNNIFIDTDWRKNHMQSE